MNTVLNVAKSLVDLLYPIGCASCGKRIESASDTGVCELCLSRIKRNPMPYCSSCGRPSQAPDDICRECLEMRPYFKCARSACVYEDCLKELVHKFKYGNRRALAGVFSSIMSDFIKDNPEITDGVDIISFIPLHHRRLHDRSFNQSELLAIYIGRELNIPVIDYLEKTKVTKNQNELSRGERLSNITGAFRLKRQAALGAIKGSNILIIDDIMTTGATLNEASRILVESGAGSVNCLTLARGA